MRSVFASNGVLIISEVNGFLITGYEVKEEETNQEAADGCYDLNYCN